jgi:hypothetical protein
MKSGGQIDGQCHLSRLWSGGTVRWTVRLLGCVWRRVLYWVLNLWISSLTDVIWRSCRRTFRLAKMCQLRRLSRCNQRYLTWGSCIFWTIGSPMVVRLSALHTVHPLPRERFSGNHFCSRLNQPPGHNMAGRIRSTKNIWFPNQESNLWPSGS